MKPFLPSGRRDYAALEVEAARRVLAELLDLLDEYRSGIVLVGGWVPFFSIPNPKTPHDGTKDVDLVLDANRLAADGDQTIEEILYNALYQQDEHKPFRWHRGVEIDGEFVKVVVDFLAAERENYPNGRLQRIQDIPASTMYGCDIALLEPVQVPLNTIKPDGSRVSTTFQMVSIPHFLAMKGLALHNRDKSSQENADRLDDARKDAYDIYFIVKNHPTGVAALGKIIKSLLHEPIMQEGLEKIQNKWQSLGDRGPMLVAAREDDGEERLRMQRDAYEQLSYLFKCIRE